MKETPSSAPQLEKFVIGIGRCANGAFWPLDLAKSHGVIIGGRQSKVAAGSILKAVFEHDPARYSVIWIGGNAPGWLGMWKGARVVGEDRAMAELEAFSSEQRSRFAAMKEAGSNNLPHYNAVAGSKSLEKWPLVFLVLEDFLSLRSSAGPRFLDELCFIARYGRASGMLPIICSEDASPERLPSLLKAEVPDRICTGVACRRDSLALLQALGGDQVGDGELLYRRMASDTSVIRLKMAG